MPENNSDSVGRWPFANACQSSFFSDMSKTCWTNIPQNCLPNISKLKDVRYRNGNMFWGHPFSTAFFPEIFNVFDRPTPLTGILMNGTHCQMTGLRGGLWKKHEIMGSIVRLDPSVMPIWAWGPWFNTDWKMKYISYDDVCHCMWGFEGVFCAMSNYAVYTDLECMVWHSARGRWLKKNISKRSRFASKADINQTWTPLRTPSKVFLKLSLCLFWVCLVFNLGESKTMYCSTLRVNMIASYPPFLQPDAKNNKIYPTYLSKKRTPGPCLPTAYFQLISALTFAFCGMQKNGWNKTFQHLPLFPKWPPMIYPGNKLSPPPKKKKGWNMSARLISAFLVSSVWHHKKSPWAAMTSPWFQPLMLTKPSLSLHRSFDPRWGSVE